eukprot:4890161-Ditylum_brightwellii.AAC.1
MAMNPNCMTFQKAQILRTPEQTRPSYTYELHAGKQLVSPEEGKEDRGGTQQTYGVSIHQETATGLNSNAESPVPQNNAVRNDGA